MRSHYSLSGQKVVGLLITKLAKKVAMVGDKKNNCKVIFLCLVADVNYFACTSLFATFTATRLHSCFLMWITPLY